MKKLFIFAIVLAFFAATANAQIYKWKDKNGNLHFSDTPQDASAQAINVQIPSSIKNVPSSTPTPSSRPGRSSRPSRSGVPAAHAGNASANQHHTITARDYDINTDVRESNGEVTVSGRIEHGPQCAHLSLTIFIHTDHGGIEELKTVVDDAGGFGSRLFKTSITPWPERPGPWFISSLYASCF